MKYSLRSIFVAISVVAALCAVFQRYPTFALSVVLLGPLPFMLVRCLCFTFPPSIRAITFMPLAAIAFYIGLIGPIAAFVFMPEEYGFLHLRKFLHANANQIYPMMHYCDRFAPSEIMYVIDQYEDGWISLAESRSRQK